MNLKTGKLAGTQAVYRAESILQEPFEKIQDGRIIDYYTGKVTEEDLIAETLFLSSSENGKIAFRASWVIENLFTRKQLPAEFADDIITIYINSDSGSVYRSYGKIISSMLARRIDSIEPRKIEPVAEKAMDLLLDEKTKPAVQVWAMEILFLLKDRYDWISENLYHIITAMASQSTLPSIRNKTGRMLKKIAGQK